MREAETKTIKRARHLRKTMTDAEVLLWYFVRNRQLGGHRIRRQVAIGPYVADFACVEAKLVIEIDGATHGTADEVAHYEKRTTYMNEQGWSVIRIDNDDIYDRDDDTLEFILNSIDKRLSELSA